MCFFLFFFVFPTWFGSLSSLFFSFFWKFYCYSISSSILIICLLSFRNFAIWLIITCDSFLTNSCRSKATVKRCQQGPAWKRNQADFQALCDIRERTTAGFGAPRYGPLHRWAHRDSRPQVHHCASMPSPPVLRTLPTRIEGGEVLCRGSGEKGVSARREIRFSVATQQYASPSDCSGWWPPRSCWSVSPERRRNLGARDTGDRGFLGVKAVPFLSLRLVIFRSDLMLFLYALFSFKSEIDRGLDQACNMSSIDLRMYVIVDCGLSFCGNEQPMEVNKISWWLFEVKCSKYRLAKWRIFCSWAATCPRNVQGIFTCDAAYAAFQEGSLGQQICGFHCDW